MFQKAGDVRRGNPEQPIFTTSIHDSAIRNRSGVIEVPFTVKLEDQVEDVRYRVKERFTPDKEDGIDELYVGYGIIKEPENWHEEK